MQNKDICREITSMLSAYIENKLSAQGRRRVESHLAECAACRKKYYEMTRIIGDLHYEYEKMMNEFDRIEADKNINLKEYEEFYSNMSPYADNELCYEDSLKFRKYLLKSKTARDELSAVYDLKKRIKQSASDFMDKTNVNFAGKVMRRIKSGNKSRKTFFNTKTAIAAVFLFLISAVIAVFILFNYSGSKEADLKNNTSLKSAVMKALHKSSVRH